jgi:cytochrome c oxidase cbb3-type subunit IV
VAEAMDIGTVRGLFTLVCMLAFIGLVFWAYSKRRKADFDEMANLPFNEYPPEKDKGSNTP